MDVKDVFKKGPLTDRLEARLVDIRDAVATVLDRANDTSPLGRLKCFLLAHNDRSLLKRCGKQLLDTMADMDLFTQQAAQLDELKQIIMTDEENKDQRRLRRTISRRLSEAERQRLVTEKEGVRQEREALEKKIRQQDQATSEQERMMIVLRTREKELREMIDQKVEYLDSFEDIESIMEDEQKNFKANVTRKDETDKAKLQDTVQKRRERRKNLRSIIKKVAANDASLDRIRYFANRGLTDREARQLLKALKKGPNTTVTHINLYGNPKLNNDLRLEIEAFVQKNNADASTGLQDVETLSSAEEDHPDDLPGTPRASDGFDPRDSTYHRMNTTEFKYS